MLFGTIIALRLLYVAHPEKGTHELLTKGAIDAVGALMQKNVGSVQAHNTRPLFATDLEQAFERSSPKSMSELSYFIQAFAHVKFGSRPSTLYPGSGDQSGLLIGHITSIVYSRTRQEYLIQIVVPSFSKTSTNPFGQEDVEIRSESKKCDFARLLVLFLALRQSFVLSLEEAHRRNDFRIRPSMKELSLFGSMTSVGRGSAYISDEGPTSSNMAKTSMDRVARILKLPEDFLTPRSGRQSFALDRALDYISNQPDATWQGCVAAAKGSDAWLSEAVEHYLKGPGNELWKCLERVRRLRSQHPGSGYVDARKYFLYVSQYSLLPEFREMNDDERDAIRVFIDEAVSSYAKKQDVSQNTLKLRAADLRQKGDEAAAKALEAKLKSKYQQQTYVSKMKIETQARAENIIKSTIIQDVIRRTMPEDYPVFPESPSQVLDVVETYKLCEELTLCQLRCQKEKLVSPTYRLHPGARVSCPIADCNQEFETSQWELLKEHMLRDHLTDDKGGTCKDCGGRTELMRTWEEWTAHVNVAHLYQICWVCKEKFTNETDIQDHDWDYGALNAHALCPMESIRFVCMEQPNPPCECPRESCIYLTSAKAQKLLRFFKEDDELFDSVTRAFGDLPDRRILIREKRDTYVKIATDVVKQANGGVIPANTERCLTTWFEEYGTS